MAETIGRGGRRSALRAESLLLPCVDIRAGTTRRRRWGRGRAPRSAGWRSALRGRTTRRRGAPSGSATGRRVAGCKRPPRPKCEGGDDRGGEDQRRGQHGDGRRVVCCRLCLAGDGRRRSSWCHRLDAELVGRFLIGRAHVDGFTRRNAGYRESVIHETVDGRAGARRRGLHDEVLRQVRLLNRNAEISHFDVAPPAKQEAVSHALAHDGGVVVLELQGRPIRRDRDDGHIALDGSLIREHDELTVGPALGDRIRLSRCCRNAERERRRKVDARGDRGAVDHQDPGAVVVRPQVDAEAAEDRLYLCNGRARRSDRLWNEPGRRSGCKDPAKRHRQKRDGQNQSCHADRTHVRRICDRPEGG